MKEREDSKANLRFLLQATEQMTISQTDDKRKRWFLNCGGKAMRRILWNVKFEVLVKPLGRVWSSRGKTVLVVKIMKLVYPGRYKESDV